MGRGPGTQQGVKTSSFIDKSGRGLNSLLTGDAAIGPTALWG